MKYNVLALDEFKKNTKKLSKRYKRIKVDVLKLIEQLENDPHIGIQLFNNCYKIRVPNSSIPTGKSGGFRVITYFIDETSNVYLLTIYSKSDQNNIPDSKIIDLIQSV